MRRFGKTPFDQLPGLVGPAKLPVDRTKVGAGVSFHHVKQELLKVAQPTSSKPATDLPPKLEKPSKG